MHSNFVRHPLPLTGTQQQFNRKISSLAVSIMQQECFERATLTVPLAPHSTQHSARSPLRFYARVMQQTVNILKYVHGIIVSRDVSVVEERRGEVG